VAEFESDRTPADPSRHPHPERTVAEPAGRVATGARPRALANQFLLLQRAAGNRAVSALVEPRAGAAVDPGLSTAAADTSTVDGHGAEAAAQRIEAGAATLPAEDAPPRDGPPDGPPDAGAGSGVAVRDPEARGIPRPPVKRAVTVTGSPGTRGEVADALQQPFGEAGRAFAGPGRRAGRPGGAGGRSGGGAGGRPGPAPDTGALTAAESTLDAVEGAKAVPEPVPGAVAVAPFVPPALPPVDDPDATVILAAAAGGEAQLVADTTAAVTDIQSSLGAQQEDLEAAAQAQIAAVQASIAQAGRRIQASVAAATASLRTGGDAQRGRLGDARTAATDRAATLVGAAETAARDQGTTRGDEAVTVAREESDAVTGQISGAAQRADELGRGRAAGARDGNPDAVTAMRQAATEISRQTSGEVRGASGTTADDLRNVGPEVRTDIVNHGDQFATQLGTMLAPLQAGIADNATQTGTALDSGLAEGFTSLAGIGTNMALTIAQLSRDAVAGIRAQTTAARNAQAATADEGIALVRRQSVAALQGGRDTTDELVAQLLSRRSRRRMGRALAADAAQQLQRTYGMSAAQARSAGQRIAACFQESAAAVHTSITESAGASTREAGGLAGQATGQVTSARSAVMSRLETLITDAVARGDAQVTGADEQLKMSLAQSDTGLVGSLARLRTELAGQASTTISDAERPVSDLGGRVDQGMARARERANRSWLENQLSDAWDTISNPGFWAGLIVGLLVTIAVIAICGTGIGALILAGALAGAASVAASTLTEHATGRRQGPIDWGGLARDMAIGAAFGALGGALGGGAAAGVLGRQVLSGAVQATARQTATNYVVQTVVGTGVGVLQNVAGPTPWDLDSWDTDRWDQGLLLNVGTNAAMNNPVADSAVGSLVNRARGAAVDSGVAVNVTPIEIDAAAGRMARRAGVDLPGDAPPVPAGGDKGPAPVAGDGAPVPAGGDQGAAPLPGGRDGPDALPRGPRRDRPAGTPEPGGPDARESTAVPATDEPELMDLPEGTSGRLPDHLATDAAANRDFYEGFMRDSPTREAALLRNTATGEYAVVQGDEGGVPLNLADPDALVPPHLRGRGRWVLESHSHPVDASGFTPESSWVPSGADADFGIAAQEAEMRGRPFQSEIRVETPDGPDVTRFGYDPGDPRPYSVDMPARGGGRETHTFATIEEYHAWYNERFGGDLGPIPDDFPGARAASADPGAAPADPTAIADPAATTDPPATTDPLAVPDRELTPAAPSGPGLNRSQRARLNRLLERAHDANVLPSDFDPRVDIDRIAAQIAAEPDPNAALAGLEEQLGRVLDDRLDQAQTTGREPTHLEGQQTRGLEEFIPPEFDPRGAPDGTTFDELRDHLAAGGQPGKGSGEWSGERGNSEWSSDHPAVIARTGGRPIEYRNGEPMLRDYAVVVDGQPARVIIREMTGQNTPDFRAAREGMMARHPGRWDNITHVEAWESGARPDNLGGQLGEPHTWHHEGDLESMTLVPTELHGNLPHRGGASAARSGAVVGAAAPLEDNPL
jgi:hypothetical protein